MSSKLQEKHAKELAAYTALVPDILKGSDIKAKVLLYFNNVARMNAYKGHPTLLTPAQSSQIKQEVREGGEGDYHNRMREWIRTFNYARMSHSASVEHVRGGVEVMAYALKLAHEQTRFKKAADLAGWSIKLGKDGEGEFDIDEIRENVASRAKAFNAAARMSKYGYQVMKSITKSNLPLIYCRHWIEESEGKTKVHVSAALELQRTMKVPDMGIVPYRNIKTGFKASHAKLFYQAVT